ncbi:hypothetical protein [Cognatiyoonia sp. IB215182]|uniref:hypothetical protein n=1 Tax=Cognatiyoonia sp. IB215182 TaxID=3097353 RepID=UPI002A149F9E|nr:hypothetical protein [Cognatiyoonia sp. IB215182]MDX8354324.1 hypothetical protein [Cognatiyoonia sp. IB215182]
MSSDIQKNMIVLSERYGAHQNLSHWRVSFLSRGDGQFFSRLKNGSGCTLKTASQVLQWFDDNWPGDLEWPSEIPRPSVERVIK